MARSLTIPLLAAAKGCDEPLVMVTAYDAPTARMATAAGVDLILVGDSLAMVVLGYDDTLQIDLDIMVHHLGAVVRTRPAPLVVADLPWLSYHLGPQDAVRNAARLVRAGAQAVKLEGGRKRLPVVRAILDAEIPVVGHVGLTPQSIRAFGGFKVQGRELDAAQELLTDAQALAEAGCAAVVLEGVPDQVGKLVTDGTPVPVIGIGAGPACDGQVLVMHDVVGFGAGRAPRFVRRYASLETDGSAAVAAWAADVRARRFPSEKESYHLAPLTGSGG